MPQNIYMHSITLSSFLFMIEKKITFMLSLRSYNYRHSHANTIHTQQHIGFPVPEELNKQQEKSQDIFSLSNSFAQLGTFSSVELIPRIPCLFITRLNQDFSFKHIH
jgi:hypothetical protein